MMYWIEGVEQKDSCCNGGLGILLGKLQGRNFLEVRRRPEAF